jgi:hypothetical protein
MFAKQGGACPHVPSNLKMMDFLENFESNCTNFEYENGSGK